MVLSCGPQTSICIAVHRNNFPHCVRCDWARLFSWSFRTHFGLSWHAGFGHKIHLEWYSDMDDYPFREIHSVDWWYRPFSRDSRTGRNTKRPLGTLENCFLVSFDLRLCRNSGNQFATAFLHLWISFLLWNFRAFLHLCFLLLNETWVTLPAQIIAVIGTLLLLKGHFWAFPISNRVRHAINNKNNENHCLSLIENTCCCCDWKLNSPERKSIATGITFMSFGSGKRSSIKIRLFLQMQKIFEKFVSNTVLFNHTLFDIPMYLW